MKRVWVNYWVDIGMLISFVLVFFTGLIKLPFLVGFIDYSVFPMIQISKIHDLSGLVMGFLAVVHVILHWDWIVAMTKKLFKK